MCTCSALCGTPKRKVTSLASAGVLLIGLLAFGLPALIKHIIERGVCDQLCVPDEAAPAWQLDNWRTNFNESMHPAEILSFSFFNVTNPHEFVAGAKPIVHRASDILPVVQLVTARCDHQVFCCFASFVILPPLSQRLDPTFIACTARNSISNAAPISTRFCTSSRRVLSFSAT